MKGNGRMKRVFLIGDSIRGGYDSYVRELLEDEAQVYCAPDSARFVQYTLRYVHEWAKHDCDPERIDLVHWNNGLWDVLHVMGDEAQSTIEEYETGLQRVAKRLRRAFPNAKIVFALTTAVMEERMAPEFRRYNSEIEAYNAAACRVMEQEGIAVNDLYAVARDMPADWHSADGTHYTEDGYRALAAQVAAAIRENLQHIQEEKSI